MSSHDILVVDFMTISWYLQKMTPNGLFTSILGVWYGNIILTILHCLRMNLLPVFFIFMAMEVMRRNGFCFGDPGNDIFLHQFVLHKSIKLALFNIHVVGQNKGG